MVAVLIVASPIAVPVLAAVAAGRASAGGMAARRIRQRKLGEGKVR